MLRVHWLAAIVAVGAAQADAVAQAPSVAVRPGETVALLARTSDEAPPAPLRLARYEARARIDGLLAETTLTLTFRNDTQDILVGELVVPLPEGATVSGYGLDIEGEIVDAVPVERRAARVAFDTELRKGVDPAIAEWVKGNNFRLRIYPIPAQGTRTVRVRYVSELVTQSDDARAAYFPLPLRFARPAGQTEVEIEVVRPPAAPEFRAGSVPGLTFTAKGDVYVARATLGEVETRDDLLVALPVAASTTVRVEKDEGGEHYFVIDDLPPLSPPAAAPPVERIGLAWDASFSRLDSDLRRELALLEALLVRLGDVEVEFTAFRDRPEPPRTFRIQRGRSRELLDHIGALPYDGGTRLDAVHFSGDVAYHVLFTDGLGTLGREGPIPVPVPLYAIASDARSDHARLRHLAEGSGGAYFNLGRIADREVLAAVGVAPFSFLSAQAAEGAVADLHPAHPRPVHGRFTLVGRLRASAAELVVRYGVIGRPAVTRTFHLQQAQATKGLVARTWAQKRVDDLAVHPEDNTAELRRLGRRFGLVTPQTSLLVLEDVEQHLEHQVEPPASRPALRRSTFASLRSEKERHGRHGRRSSNAL